MAIRSKREVRPRSISAFLCFETVFHCMMLAVVLPLYRSLLQLALDWLHVPVLGWDELYLLFSAPAALLAQLLALLLVLFFLYWDLTALYVYCDGVCQSKRFSAWDLWRESFLAALPVLHWRRLALLGLLPLLFFSICPLAIRLSRPLRIPTLFLDLFLAWPMPLWGAVVLPAALSLLLLLYFFGLPAVILDRQGGLTSVKTGLRLLRRQAVPLLRRLPAALVLYACAALALTVGAVAALAGVLRLFYGQEAARYLFRSTVLYWSPAWGLLLVLLLALTLAGVSVSLYRPVPPAVPVLSRTPRQRLRSVLSLVCSAALVAFFALTLPELPLGPALPVTSTVVAHRGATALAPENTLAALEAAIALRADMVEIDVRQTRDQAFVVIHDASTKRVSGEDLKVEETWLKDLERLDVGSSFSPDYAGEPIPTLREALACAKDRITLMIEVKSTGRNQEYRLLSLVRQYGMLQQCIFASKDLDTLHALKELEPAVQTVYITSYLLPGEYALADVDGYSLRLSALSRQTAIRLRAQGKPIYGWTANTPLDLRRLLLCDVDGIVTDDVTLAQMALKQRAQSTVPDRLTEWFFPAE